MTVALFVVVWLLLSAIIVLAFSLVRQAERLEELQRRAQELQRRAQQERAYTRTELDDLRQRVRRAEWLLGAPQGATHHGLNPRQYLPDMPG